VGTRGLGQSLIRVLSDPPPFMVTHERSALGHTRWQLKPREFRELTASDRVLSGVVPALPDPVEIQAERVFRRSIANPAVPAVVVPRDPEVEVIDHGSDFTVVTVSIVQIQLIVAATK
jgi:hypothetical protein